MTSSIEGATAKNTVDIAVMASEQKHFNTALTELAKSNTHLADIVSTHTEQLGEIEQANKIKGWLYNFIDKHWWKLALAVIAIDKTYDVVRAAH